MTRIVKIKLFLIDFLDKFKGYYAIYGSITSTILFSIIYFYFLEYLSLCVIFEIIILLAPLIIFYFLWYEKKISCEVFNYFEKLGKYKTKPQLLNTHQNEIIIKNSKKYIFYLQLKIGKRIEKYELTWDNLDNSEITLKDKLDFFDFVDNILICNENKNSCFILAFEFIYLDTKPINTEFSIFSKIKKKKKKIFRTIIKLR